MNYSKYFIACELIRLKKKGLIDVANVDSETIEKTICLICERVEQMQSNNATIAELLAKTTENTLKALFPVVNK